MNNNKNRKEKFANLKFLIITHTFVTGPSQELRNFFVKNKISFAFLEHPFSFNEREKRSKITFFKEGKEIRSFQGIKIKGPDLFYFIKDFLYTLYFIVELGKKYDVCVAADNLNTLAAWLLKKLGFINKLVYWTIDYTPKRFENRLLNEIYHLIDRFCCYYADLLWDSAQVMKEARKAHGVRLKKMKPVIIVEDGNNFEEDKIKGYDELKKYKLVYMGHLRENQGIELLIDVAEELNKWNKEITLLIIGGGKLSETLKEYVKKRNISQVVEFTGFVESHSEVEARLRECYLSFALYKDDPSSFSKYSAVGKPKAYTGCGLPVIITDVPEIARKIDSFGAGKVVPYDKTKIVEEVKKIISDKSLYQKMRERAIEFARENTWEKIFSQALGETNEKTSPRLSRAIEEYQ